MNAATGKPALIFRAGASACALDLPHVVEILRPLPVEPLAGTPTFVQGLAVIRGEAVPVVSVAALLAGTGSAATRFVVVRAGERRVALAVDAVQGVFELADALLETLPPLTRTAAAALEAMAVLDGQLLLVLDEARIVPEEVWEQWIPHSHERIV